MKKEYLLVFWRLLTKQKRMAPEKWTRILLTMFVLVLMLWAVLVFWIDPYLRWHRAVGLKQVYDNSYAMMPGVLRHFDYDTILFGSSLTQNTRISDIERFCGGKAIKGTSPGLSGADSRRYFLLAAKRGTLKRVLWNVDPWLLEKPESAARWLEYDYLYELCGVEKYLLSKDTLDAILKVLTTNFSPESDATAVHLKNPDLMFANKPGRHIYNRQVLLESLRHEHVSVHLTSGMAAVEKYLLSSVREHPEIKFDFLLPPYHLYFWCYLQQTGDLEEFLDFREKFSLAVSALPNARLHDFQLDLPVITTADNYKDLLHFSPAINCYLMEQIGAGSFVAFPETVREHNRQLRELVRQTMPEYLSAAMPEKQ